MQRIVFALLCLAAFAVSAQQPRPAPALPSVSVRAPGDPVQKSYRRMVAGMDLFERMHHLAPRAQLRYKLLPRKPGTSLHGIDLAVVGDTISYPIPIAPDFTFTLTRDPKAIAEGAVVMPDRRKLTMTWRTDIRTPGLPPNTRRLGDLRLECLVGVEAGLVSNTNPLVEGLDRLFTSAAGYCNDKDVRYLLFADKPVFGVTLVAGNRREVLPIDRLYNSASDDPGLKQDLPFCDCEVLLDRTYFAPLGDKSWPDDTHVVFEFMED